MHTLERVFNQFEAALWILLSVGFTFGAFKTSGQKRRLAFITAASLLVFGLSDIIESRTGAWWTPWWLLVIKVVCVLTFTYGYVRYRKLQKQIR